MPAGELTTDPPNCGSTRTCNSKVAAGGGVVVPRPEVPGPLFMEEDAGNGQASKTQTSLTSMVQLSCQTGLVPLAANWKGSPTPPVEPPGNMPLRESPCVSAPVVESTAKGSMVGPEFEQSVT